MSPAAPGWFSITTARPMLSLIFCATMRSMMSTALPACSGISIRIGFAGYSCAAAGSVAASSSATRYFTRDRLGTRQRLLHPLRRERHLAQAHARGIEEGVRDRRGDHADGRLARAGGRELRMVDEHDVDRLGRVLDVEHRIARPIDARHLVPVEAHFLEERARQPVHHVAL